MPALADSADARRQRLRRDLEDCAAEAETAPIEVAASISGAFAVGCFYTLMGSSLGGKIIHRQLDYLFDGLAGRRFFAGSHDDAAHWQSFCRALENYGTRSERVPCLGAGATFGFEHFSQCLEDRL